MLLVQSGRCTATTCLTNYRTTTYAFLCYRHVSPKVTLSTIEEAGTSIDGGKREPDRSEADIAGEGLEPKDLPPRFGSGIMLGGDGGRGKGPVGSMDPPPQPGDPEATAEDEYKGELGQSKIRIDEGEVGLMYSLPQLGGGGETKKQVYSGNRRAGCRLGSRSSRSAPAVESRDLM